SVERHHSTRTELLPLMPRQGSLVAVVLLLGACRPASAPGRVGTRIVSLHEVTTELVVALGAADRLVGIAEPVDATPAVCAAVAGVPRVGSMESILAVRPDLVLGLHVVGPDRQDAFHA